MSDEAEEPRIIRPQRLDELLSEYGRRPQALLFAGGTAIMHEAPVIPGVGVMLPSEIICLGGVEELNKISRTERYLEIGATVTISRVLSVGRNAVPGVLYEALCGIGAPSVRNLATVGGNMCTVPPYGDSLSSLWVLDAAVEVRRHGKSAWTPVSQFYDESGRPRLGGGEMVTRIRVPYQDTDIDIYRKIGERSRGGRPLMSLCATAKLSRGVLNDFKVAFGLLGPRVARSRELEMKLIGRKLPLMDRDQRQFLAEWRGFVETMANGSSARATATAIRLGTWLMEQLAHPGMKE